MKGLASILHQVIKFATPEVKRPFYGDQVVAKYCYLNMIFTKADMEEVQLIEKEHKGLEDVGRAPKAKVVEVLICYELDKPSSDYFFSPVQTCRNKRESSSSSSSKQISRTLHGPPTR